MKNTKTYDQKVVKHDSETLVNGKPTKRYHVSFDLGNRDIERVVQRLGIIKNHEKFKVKKHGNKFIRELKYYVSYPSDFVFPKDRCVQEIKYLVGLYKKRNNLVLDDRLSSDSCILLSERRSRSKNIKYTVILNYDSRRINIIRDNTDSLETSNGLLTFPSNLDMLLWFIHIQTEKDLWDRLNLKW